MLSRKHLSAKLCYNSILFSVIYNPFLPLSRYKFQKYFFMFRNCSLANILRRTVNNKIIIIVFRLSCYSLSYLFVFCYSVYLFLNILSVFTVIALWIIIQDVGVVVENKARLERK